MASRARLYVSNIPYETSEADLRAAFSAYGSVEEVKVITDRDTGKPRGFCFVQMSSPKEASEAIAGLDNTNFQGRTMHVSEAKEESRHGGGGGGGGGGGRGHRDRGHGGRRRDDDYR